jgi:hypothetical protein
MSEAPLALHPLTRLHEGDGILVGRPDAESYVVLPLDGAALLERLIEGMAPSAAAAWYHDTFAESVDIDDFTATLDELGFLRSGAAEATVVAAPVRLQWLGRMLFSPVALAAYGALVTVWIWTLTRRPELAPSPRHLFFTSSIVLAELLVVCGQWPWLFLHEAFHVLAGRRLGLASRVGVGRRLCFVVFETRMPSLLSVERRRRHVPFLAGMLADVVAVASLGVFAYALSGRTGVTHTLRTVALAMAFPICARFAYQFILFLQSDVYYVLATALGCYDLHAATQARVMNRYWKLGRRPERMFDEGRWTSRDRQVARYYEPLFAGGIAVLLAIWCFALLPATRLLVHLLLHALRSGPTDARFWDGTLFVSLNVAQLVVLFAIARRDRRHRSLSPSPEPE